METVAITVWNGLVSPLFDAAAEIVVVESRGARTRIDTGDRMPQETARILHDQCVRILICGAISAPALAVLRERGIRVIPWICGPVEDVLEAYGDRTLETREFFMPGCRGTGTKRGRRGGCRKGNPDCLDER
jgi:predicted Fe-Mo cluster-binding NifX family protein